MPLSNKLSDKEGNEPFVICQSSQNSDLISNLLRFNDIQILRSGTKYPFNAKFSGELIDWIV